VDVNVFLKDCMSWFQ